MIRDYVFHCAPKRLSFRLFVNEAGEVFSAWAFCKKSDQYVRKEGRRILFDKPLTHLGNYSGEFPKRQIFSPMIRFLWDTKLSNITELQAAANNKIKELTLG